MTPTKRTTQSLPLGVLLLCCLAAACGGGGPVVQPVQPTTISSVSVSPSTATLDVGTTQQFTPTVNGAGNFNPAVNWFVNDIAGGNPSFGTISTSGAYTAPSSVPSPNNLVVVKAISVADSSKSATAMATVADIALRAGSSLYSVTQTESVTLPNGQVVSAAKDEVLVFAKEDITSAELGALKTKITSLGGTVIGSSPKMAVIQVRLSPTASETTFITGISSTAGVANAGLNLIINAPKDNASGYQKYLQKLRSGEIMPVKPITFDALSYPPFKGDFWINVTKADQAWDITTGSALDDAIIGVVDSGIRSGQQVLAENRLERYDATGKAITDDDSPTSLDHGKSVIGFAAGYIETSTTKIRGVAWLNRVISVDVFSSSGTTPTTTVLQGLETAITKGARIINASIGFNDCTDTQAQRLNSRRLFREALTPAINLAKRNDRLIIFAASNGCEKQDDSLFTPGSSIDGTSWNTHVLRVAATTNKGVDASFSDMGATINLAAPGEDIGWGDGRELDGTSFAAPLVTGTTGLMRAANPTLSAPELRYILLSSAEPLSLTRKPDLLLNAQRAVSQAISTKNIPLTVESQVSLTKDATKTVTVSVTVPSSTVQLMDALFLIDTTGSYDDDIATLQKKATEIVDNLSSRGIDVQFGLASFADFPFLPFGIATANDRAFYLNQSITNNFGAVKSAIDSLIIHDGRDLPESQLEALYQAATGVGRDLNADGDYTDLGEISPSNIGWRTGSLKVLILATDAQFHNPDTETSYPRSATFSDVIGALTSRGMTVIGLDSSPGAVAIPDLQKIVNPTGGTLYNLSADSAEIAAKIAQAITTKLQQITLTIQTVSGSEWISNISPASFTNVTPGQTKTFSVDLKGVKNSGVQSLTYDVYLWVMGDKSAILKRVRIPIVVPSS